MATGKPVATDEEAGWLAQWRFAATALHEERASELRQMTPADAWSAIEAVLTFPLTTPLPDERLTDSGLVEMQRHLQKLRSQPAQ